MFTLLKLDNCTQPAIITKDFCLILTGRDSRTFPRLTTNTKSLKQFFSGAYKNSSSNHVSTVYELVFKRAVDSGSPGVQRRQRRVLDTSNTYVRGEENLDGWQPRGDSLIFDHQWELEKIKRIVDVEKVKHDLLIRDKMKGSSRPEVDEYLLRGMKQSASRMSLVLTSPTSPIAQNQIVVNESIYEPWEMNERERELSLKYIQLMQTHIPSKPPPINKKKNSIQNPYDKESMTPNLSSPESSSPDKTLNYNCWMNKSAKNQGKTMNNLSPPEMNTLTHPDIKPLYVPEFEEIRISPMVSRKGYLNCLDDKTNQWVKQWIVVKRPYLFIFNDENDPIERGIINLSSAQVEYSDDQLAMLKVTSAFSIVTKYRGYLFQTLNDKEIYDWLYAINPLLAGEIKSKMARNNKNQDNNSMKEQENIQNQCNI